MQTRLQLFTKWGITFDEPYRIPEQVTRKVRYADKDKLLDRINLLFHQDDEETPIQVNIKDGVKVII